MNLARSVAQMKSTSVTAAIHSNSGRPFDYVSLVKPRSIMPHLLTAASTMLAVAGRSLSGSILLLTLLGGALVAAAANTFNSYLDRDIDAVMARTGHRPLPDGRLRPIQALAFGTALGLAGIGILGRLVSWWAAGLAALALVYYVLPYTLWLKRRTYWSTIVCSGIGAVPPLVGSVAATGRIELPAVILSAVVVFWTMPHFWSFGIFRRRDYERAGVRLISDSTAASWTVIFAVPVVAMTVLLAPVAHMGPIYLPVAASLALGLLAFAVRLLRKMNHSTARQFYVYSIVYLVAVFGAIITDRLIR